MNKCMVFGDPISAESVGLMKSKTFFGTSWQEGDKMAAICIAVPQDTCYNFQVRLIADREVDEFNRKYTHLVEYDYRPIITYKERYNEKY